MIIKVNDTNDNPPQLDGPLSFTLSENQPLHTIVGVVRAKDVDTESKLAYSLINGTAGRRIIFWCLEHILKMNLLVPKKHGLGVEQS